MKCIKAGLLAIGICCLNACSDSALAPNMTYEEKKCVEDKTRDFFIKHMDELKRYSETRSDYLRQHLEEESKAYRQVIIRECINEPRARQLANPAKSTEGNSLPPMVPPIQQPTTAPN